MTVNVLIAPPPRPRPCSSLQPVPVPRTDVERVARAHERFVQAIDSLTDEHMRSPSLLPGWSIGHVLTHVARNADSHVRRTDAALRGEFVDQYPGGLAGRSAEIEAGAGRTAPDVIDDVRRSASEVDRAWRDLSPGAWSGRSGDSNGQVRFLFELPCRRWQELEVHLVDLGIGFNQHQWPDDFVVEWLPRTREQMWERLPAEARALEFDSPADQLAWLYGRLKRSDLPELPPWG